MERYEKHGTTDIESADFHLDFEGVLCNEFALPPSAMSMMAEHHLDTVLWYWDR